MYVSDVQLVGPLYKFRGGLKACRDVQRNDVEHWNTCEEHGAAKTKTKTPNVYLRLRTRRQ